MGHRHLAALNHSYSYYQTCKKIPRRRPRYPSTRCPTLNTKHYNGGRTTINMLPEDVLLEIFDCYVYESDHIDGWHLLVHVCRKWRYIVFASPRRLNLRLHCTAGRPVKERLDIWPPLPIILEETCSASSSVDNIVAALGQNGRISQVMLRHTSGSLLDDVLTAMQLPFPALARLHLESKDQTVPVISDSFLGGSAPHLRSLCLDGIPFPGLPKLLVSSTDLVDLSLLNIPHSGYISPQAIANSLSALTRLKSLTLYFQSPRCRPGPGAPYSRPLFTRTVLPALTELRFTGVSEYFEDLVARIDTPQLRILYINFFLQLIFDTPKLAEFISRTPQFTNHHHEAQVVFSDSGATLTLSQTIDDSDNRGLELRILCQQMDWQLSSLAQVYGSYFPHALVSAVERLYILERQLSPHHWENGIENGQWIELFRPFTAVRNLYLSKGFALRVMLALQEFVQDTETEALPALRSLHLEASGPTSPGYHREVRSCATAPQTLDNTFSMGQSTEYGQGPVTLIDLSIPTQITFGIFHLNTAFLFNTHHPYDTWDQTRDMNHTIVRLIYMVPFA